MANEDPPMAHQIIILIIVIGLICLMIYGAKWLIMDYEAPHRNQVIDDEEKEPIRSYECIEYENKVYYSPGDIVDTSKCVVYEKIEK